MQTRLGSVVESLANIAVGFTLNFTVNLIVLPWFGFDVKPIQALGIGVVFTVISLVRSFLLRRLFNRVKASWNATVKGPVLERGQ